MSRHQKAFTLIEMLIVIVIIGILAAALIPRLQSVQARSRDVRRKADLTLIANGLTLYKVDMNTYPTGAGLTSMFDSGGQFPLVPHYIPTLPQDDFLKKTPLYIGIQWNATAVPDVATSLYSSGSYGYLGLYERGTSKVKSILLIAYMENISSANRAVPQGYFQTPNNLLLYPGLMTQFSGNDVTSPWRTVYTTAVITGTASFSYDDVTPISTMLCKRITKINAGATPRVFANHDPTNCTLNMGAPEGTWYGPSKWGYRYIYAN